MTSHTCPQDSVAEPGDQTAAAETLTVVRTPFWYEDDRDRGEEFDDLDVPRSGRAVTISTGGYL